MPSITLSGNRLTACCVLCASMGPLLMGLTTGYASPVGLTIKDAVKYTDSLGKS